MNGGRAPYSSRQRALVGVLLVLTLVCGCAHNRPIVLPGGARQDVELTATPFFAQATHQCGPAALATVLNASGARVTPEQLVPQIYLPGRRGSLQLELIAAARRHQRIPYVLSPDANALFAELDAGHPVLVLQDLGVGPLHVWHYAVVVGYQSSGQMMLLRSGTTERLEMPYADFIRSWRKSKQWAMVTLAGHTLPATADAARYVASIVPLEALGELAVARDAYAAALVRWPDNLVASFGLATTEYRLGHLSAAGAGYERVLRLSPGNPSALNNLAEVMLGLGCATRAVSYADAALANIADTEQGGELRAAIGDTRAKAIAAQAAGRDAAACSR